MEYMVISDQIIIKKGSNQGKRGKTIVFSAEYTVLVL